MRHQRGFTLFEILIVLTVGALVMLGSFRAYQRVRTERRYTYAERSLHHIMAGAVAYFYQHCKADDFNKVVHLEDLVREHTIDDSAHINTRWLNDFRIRYFVPNPQVATATIEIRANLQSTSDKAMLSEVANRLGAAADSSNNDLVWKTTPQQVIDTVSTSLWSSAAKAQQFARYADDPQSSVNRCLNWHESKT